MTNAGPAHLEGFGDLEGVARAKGEVFARLGSDGLAVINADDVFAPLWRELAGHCQVIEFGLRANVPVTANGMVMRRVVMLPWLHPRAA